MAGFNGRWSLSAVDGAAAFYDAIKSPEEHKAKLRKLAEAVKQDASVYVEEIKIEGNTIHRVAIVNGEKKKDSGPQPLNTEVSAQLPDGRHSKTKIVKESDTKLVRTDVADGLTITTVFEVKGDELSVTQSSGGVSASEKFKRVG